IPAGERSELAGQIRKIGEAALQHLEWEKILELAALAPALDKETELIAPHSQGKGLRLGYCWDEAFSFYYPENLEALEKTGAKLEKINTLHQAVLPPDLDGLYIGGGFPEVFAAELEANHSLRQQIRCKAEQGMPIYAECGGLIYLSQSLTWQGQSHQMVGLFPLEIEMTAKPQGHGYEKVRVEKPNPYFAVGSELIGHEFHNTRVVFQPDFQPQNLVFGLQKGSGMGQVEGIKRDGITQKRVLASYLHIHALAVPQWASTFVRLAEQYQKERLHK
ncbi:MAG: cobyrinic acid a,c-diamide synthase, partial [Clostridia bacterium]|nr:cobyrinic acid a,c-diamide synthase [Clostridia bacterium]